MPRLNSLRQLALASALAAVSGTAALACGMETSWVEADYNAVFTDSILSVSTAAAEDPTMIHLTVEAQVPTAGYSNPALEQVYYVVEPADGIYEIYVMANPPAEMAAEVMSTVEMSLDLPAQADGISGYRLIAGGNCVTIMLDSNGLPPPEDGCAVQSLSV